MPPASAASSFQNSMPVTPAGSVSPRLPRGQFSPHKSHRLPVVIGIIVVALLVIAGAAYAASSIIMAPGNTLPGMFASLDTATKTHTDLTVVVNSGSQDVPDATLSISTDMDTTMTDNASVDSVISLVTELAAQKLVAAQKLTYAGEIKLVNNVLYGEVSTYPASMASYASAFANRWYSVSLDTLKSLSGAASSTAPVKTHPRVSVLYDNLTSAGVLSDVSFAGIVRRNGSFVRKYTMTVNKQALVRFAESMYATALASSTPSAFAAYSAQADQQLSAMFDGITFQPVVVYASLLGGAFQGVDVGIVAAGAAPAGMGSSTAPSRSMAVTIGLNYDGSRTNISISAPSNVTSLDDYLRSTLSSLTGSRNLGTDARIKSDIEQIRTQKEVTYSGSSYKGMCGSDKTMLLLASDIQSSGSTLICHETNQAYALAAKLTTPTAAGAAQYFCLDSAGKTATLAKAPVGTSCK